MSDTEGLRVRQLRIRRGLTQSELSEAAGVDMRRLREVENNPNTGKVLLSTLHSIARVLEVHTSALFTAPHPAEEPPQRHDVHSLRVLLEPPPAPTEPPTPETIRVLVRDAELALRDNDLLAAMPAVSELIPSARLAVDSAASDHDRTQARRTLTEGYDHMSTLLVLLGEPELALKAADRLAEVAAEEGNPVWAARATSVRNWPLMRQGMLGEIIRGSEAAAAMIEPDIHTTDAERLALWEHLMRWVSGAAARDNQPDMAAEAVRRAGIAAAMLGRDRVVMGHASGPTLVAIRAMENAVVAEDYGKAAKLTRSIPRGGKVLPRDRQRHALDLANIAVEHRQADRAVSIFKQLHEDAPVWLQSQPYALAVASKLVRSAKRRLSPEVREIADFMSVPA